MSDAHRVIGAGSFGEGLFLVIVDGDHGPFTGITVAGKSYLVGLDELLCVVGVPYGNNERTTVSFVRKDVREKCELPAGLRFTGFPADELVANLDRVGRQSVFLERVDAWRH